MAFASQRSALQHTLCQTKRRSFGEYCDLALKPPSSSSDCLELDLELYSQLEHLSHIFHHCSGWRLDAVPYGSLMTLQLGLCLMTRAMALAESET